MPLLLLFLFLPLLPSCSHTATRVGHSKDRGFKAKESKASVLKRSLGRLCLSGEGKGRLYRSGIKYPFSYESLWESGMWTLAVDFPFQDSKIFRFSEKEMPGKFLGLVDRIQRGGGEVFKGCKWQKGKKGKQGKRGLVCLQGPTRAKFLFSTNRVVFRVKHKESKGAKAMEIVGTLSRPEGEYFKRMFFKAISGKKKIEGKVEFLLENCYKRRMGAVSFFAR